MACEDPGAAKKDIHDMALVVNTSSEFTHLSNYIQKEDNGFNLSIYNGWDLARAKEAGVVLVGGSSRCADGNDLANYVDEGGVVIVHSYCCCTNYATNSCGGRFMSKYHPITFGAQGNYNNQNVSVKPKEDNHPEYFPDLMTDVSPSNVCANMSNYCYRGNNANVQGDAVPLIDYSDGNSFVAYRLVGDGMVVSINMNFCQSYGPQITGGFWTLLQNIIRSCLGFRNNMYLTLEESFAQFEEFEHQKNFVQCVSIVSKLNKRFNSTKKKLDIVKIQFEKLESQRESLEHEYQTGAKVLEDLTKRIKNLREIHECNCDNWSSEDVCQWLTSLHPSWSGYADVFRKNEVSGDLLVDLTDAEMRTLGVAKLRDRRKILSAIASLIEGKEGDGARTTPKQVVGEVKDLKSLS